MASIESRHPYARAGFVCTLCHSAFSNKGNLKRHHVTCTGPKLPKAPTDLKCERCDKHFAQKWNLQCHQRSCTGPKVSATPADLTCPKCDKPFSSKAYCTRHFALCTGPKPPVDLTCEHCDKQFGDAWSCKRHRRTCTGPKASNTSVDRTCRKCDKLFSSKAYCASHSILCTGPKPPAVVACEHCGRQFGDAWSCKRHQRTCTGPKVPLPPADLTCDQCGFVFTTAFSLNRHRGGCGVEYTCAKGCGATFTDRRAYCKHENACTWRPRVLFCRVCGDRPGFYDEAHYAEHVAKHHADDPELPPCAVRPPPYTVSVGRYTCTACGFAAITMAQFRLHCRDDHDGIVTAPKWNGVPERGEGPLGTEWDFDAGTYAAVQADDTCRPGASPAQSNSGSPTGPASRCAATRKSSCRRKVFHSGSTA
jgi:hypothetical protein